MYQMEFSEQYEDYELEDSATVFLNRAHELEAILADIKATDSELVQLALSARSELEQLCPYYSAAVFISGLGLIPDIKKIENNEIYEVKYDYSEGLFGNHLGVDVSFVEDKRGHHWGQIKHMILMGSMMHRASPFVSETKNIFALFDLDAEILSLDAVEDAYPQANYNLVSWWSDSEIDDIAQSNSKEVLSLVRSTKFRRATQVKQVDLLQEKVYKANTELPAHGADIFATAQYAVAPTITDNQTLSLVSFDMSEHVLHGEYLGFGSLDCMLAMRKAIRSDKDLFSKYAGLCLVVDPYEETRQSLSLKADQVLYVPISNKKIEFELRI
jgi:hypothetical protein